MKVKEKLDRITKTVALMLLIMFGISLLFAGEIQAKVTSGANRVEEFKDDVGNLAWNEHPVKELSDFMLSFWCAAHKKDVDGYMTAPQALYDAYYGNTYGKAYYNENSPYKYYTNRPGESYGLVPDHKDIWQNFCNRLKNRSYHSRHATTPSYEGDDQSYITQLRASLPGIGTEAVKSIEFNRAQTLSATTNPGAAYVLTTSPIHENPMSLPMEKGGEALSAEQKELGYFTLDEKQGALWNSGNRLGVNWGAENDYSDRNLGEIAYQYQLFYQKIHSTQNGYADLVQAYPVDRFGNVIGYNGDTDLSTNGTTDYIGPTITDGNGTVPYPGYGEGDNTSGGGSSVVTPGNNGGDRDPDFDRLEDDYTAVDYPGQTTSRNSPVVTPGNNGGDRDPDFDRLQDGGPGTDKPVPVYDANGKQVGWTSLDNSSSGGNGTVPYPGYGEGDNTSGGNSSVVTPGNNEGDRDPSFDDLKDPVKPSNPSDGNGTVPYPWYGEQGVDYPGQNPSNTGKVDYAPIHKYDNYIEETQTELNGQNYKTYVYKDTVVEIDQESKCYVLGPYCIDYSNNDTTRDIYSSTGTNQVKFNSIENITIYNQNKQNIQDLGGYFKIAYSYNGEVNAQNEGKIHRISDKAYYEMADYAEISGFTSLRPFYIVVYRGAMKAEDFSGFYAKIDFQYLKDLTAEMSVYEGNVVSYYYTEKTGSNYTYGYSGRYCRYRRDSSCRKLTLTQNISVPTVEFELHREYSGESAQEMLAYLHNGNRTYATYSIILTSETTPKDEFKIGLRKECSEEEEELYGAKFQINIEAYGENLQGKKVKKKMKFTKTTNKEGMLTITNSVLTSKGLELSEFTGEVYITFIEKKAPAGHAISDEEIDMYLEFDNGELVNIDGTNEIEEEENIIYMYAYNDHGGTPAIQLAKVNKDNELLKEAYFDVYVSYTDPDGVKFSSDGTVRKYGELINKQYNVIKGQTKDGYLNLTVDDFKNMPYGFDIEDYTGKITLKITEAGISEAGYSISSDSISVTLEYQYGILVKYTENTDAEVMVHYLYDDPLQNIYKWAKGEEKLYSYIEDNIKDWVTKQQEKTGKSYEDVLAWLVKYIEDGGKGTEIDMKEWDAGTYTVTDTGYGNGKLVQIVVEDKPGTYTLDDMPDTIYRKNDLTMTIGGTVFLDQTTTKGQEDESDGKFDEEVEETLEGIEVTLYDAKTNKPAKLIQEEGTIRTNPTITNKDGYYEFNGVDAMGTYYVVFTYNGIEYETTKSEVAKYGSKDWTISSKGSEISNNRDKYTTISSDVNVYDYYELKGIYNTITNIRIEYIKKNEYPSWDTVVSEVMAAIPDDEELEDKLEYIKNCQATAKAGYASTRADGTYPHESIEMKFLTNVTSTIEGNTEIITTTYYFAGDTVSLLYPSGLQVHLGLVERKPTDLELDLGIVDTTVSMNRYDTKYDYDVDLSAHHQYIYEEDYNYATSSNNEGIAYYTEDNIHLYVTYEIVITNTENIDTQLREVVDYYNSEFRWESEYTTTKGNKIKGLQAWFNDTEIAASASSNAKYGKGNVNADNKDYKANYIQVGNGYNIKDGDRLVIHVTYELVGDTNGDSSNAREVLKKYLLTDEGAEYSNSWAIAHYSEINAYYTYGAHIDSDSHPGNFVIVDFEEANEAYRAAYDKYVASGFEEEEAREVKLAMIRLQTVREDDAWKVTQTLTNNGVKRTIKGSVAEFVNDTVKSTLDLQSEYDNGERYVLYDENYIKEHNLGIEGITVELVELLQDGDIEHGATQVVRAVTKTDENGNYQFKSFIAGNYTVRFVYGDYDSKEDTIYSKISKNTYEDKDKADFLPINGQYYQSTKANPTTDNNKYWYYSDKEYKSDIKETSASELRYSDAYDDAFSRITQMSSVIEGAEDTSTSALYNYDGVIEVESTKHTDPIYAYTSTMELEVEYVRPDIIGNNDNDWYTYTIGNVDFGLTPRAYNDMTIGRHVSNIKLYIEGSTLNEDDLLVLDVDFDENGKVTDSSVGSDIVMDVLDDSWNLDGVINIFYEQIVQQRAHLEVTYTIDVSNDSLYDKENKIYDTIQYIADNSGKVVSVVYYGENIDKLTGYETIGENTSAMVYHNSMTDDGYSKNLNKENRNQENNIEMVPNARLGDYNLSTEYTSGDRKIITSKAVNIVDYPNDPLDFIQKNYKGEDVNLHWTSTEPEEFVSSREAYNIENGEITRNETSTVGEDTGLLTQSHIIKAATANNEETGVTVSPLLDTLIPGETRTDTLVLQHTLWAATFDITGDSKTTDLTALDEEYSNLIEITRLANSAGKVVDIEGYDIKGKGDAETSRVRNIGDYDDETNTFAEETEEGIITLTPTISTGKSETTVITDPAGVSSNDRNIALFTVIAVIILSILSGGIVLIKKNVLTK